MNLAPLLKKYAYRTGTFTLAAGGTSNEYVDVKNASLHPVACREMCRCIVYHLKTTPLHAVAGVVAGGVPLATLTSQILSANELIAKEPRLVYNLMVRPAAKTHGLGGLIDGLENVRGLGTPHTLVALIEDVVTSGASTLNAIEALTWEGLQVVVVIVIVDREQGGMQRIRERLPDALVVNFTTLSAIRAAE